MAAAEHDYVLYQRGEGGESDAWDDSVLIKAYDDAVSAMKAKLAEQHPEFSISQPSSKTKKKKKSKSKQKKKAKNISNMKWSVGDLCQAAYTEDNEIYEARILSINEDKGTCVVQYIGYGNEEEQLLSALLTIENVLSSQEHKTDTASEPESIGRGGHVQETHGGKHRSKKSSSHSKQRVPKWPWNNHQPQPSFSQMPPPPQVFPHFQPPPPFPGYQASGPNTTAPPMFPCVPPPPPLFKDRGSSEENEALYSMLISWYMSGYHTGYYQGLVQTSVSASAAAGHGAHR